MSFKQYNFTLLNLIKSKNLEYLSFFIKNTPKHYFFDLFKNLLKLNNPRCNFEFSLPPLVVGISTHTSECECNCIDLSIVEEFLKLNYF